MEHESIEKALKEHPLLEDLPEGAASKLMACVSGCRFGEGEFLFRAGDPATRFFLIRSGTVRVEFAVPAGDEIPIQTLTAGEVLGWSWLMKPYKRHFDARALDEVRCLAVDGPRLLEIFEEDRDLGYRMLKRLSGLTVHRLRATQLQLLAIHRSRFGSEGPS
jgi:CRP-like cAMP-binding protein